MFLTDKVPDGLHGQVAGRQLVGAALQLPRNHFRIFDVFLVLHLVFQTGPGIHGNGAKLDFHEEMAGIVAFHVFQGCFQPGDEVVAAVAVGFGVFDVVFSLHNGAAGEGADEIDIFINVIEKTAYDADADGIVNVIEGGRGSFRKVFPPALVPHAFFRFDAVNQVFIGCFSRFFLSFFTEIFNLGNQGVKDLGQRVLPGAVYGFVHGNVSFFVSNNFSYYTMEKRKLYRFCPMVKFYKNSGARGERNEMAHRGGRQSGKCQVFLGNSFDCR